MSKQTNNISMPVKEASSARIQDSGAGENGTYRQGEFVKDNQSIENGQSIPQDAAQAQINDITAINDQSKRSEIGAEIELEEYKDSKPIQRRKSFVDSLSGSMKDMKLEVGEISFRKIEIAEDITKLSLFMLINQAYFKKEGKNNCCKRMFIILLELMALSTLLVQYYLLSLLWTNGLTYETKSATALANPDMKFILKPDTTTNLDIDLAMLIALGVVYLLIGLDLLDHLNVNINLLLQLSMLYEQGYLLEGIFHLAMIAMQIQYSLLMAYYSFYVIYQQDGYQNIFMNATALLFLNEFDDYVCQVMKQFITEKDEPLFLVLKVTQLDIGVKLNFQQILQNFYPKIYSVSAVIYSFVNIYLIYFKYPEALEVPSYMGAFVQQLIALGIIVFVSFLLFGLILIPLVCFGTALGDANNIGLGFATLDFDEVQEFNKKHEKSASGEAESAQAQDEKPVNEFDK